MAKGPTDQHYFQNLWERAQFLGLRERDPEQVNTFLQRWAELLSTGKAIPVDEGKILGKMLREVLAPGADARAVFHPKRPDGKRVRKLGNDESVHDLFRSKRSTGLSQEDAVWDLEEELETRERTVEAKYGRSRAMDACNRERMERLAALDAFRAFKSGQFPNLEQACLNYAAKCGFDSHGIHKLAKEIFPK